MRQRIGLAQALLGEPELVFLDEPTSGLDPLGRLLVRDVIRELKAAGHHRLPELAPAERGRGDLRPGRLREGRPRDPRADRSAAAERDLEVELRLDRAAPELLAGLERFGSDVRADGACVRLRVAGSRRFRS